MATLPNPRNPENVFLVLAGCLLTFLLVFFLVVICASCQYVPQILKVSEHTLHDVNQEIENGSQDIETQGASGSKEAYQEA